MYNSDIYNEHLNIFNYYGRGKTCEDNLSRILTRILMEDEYKNFQNEILNILDIDGNIDCVFSHIGINKIKNYIFNNQIKIDEYIPVTLTAMEESVDDESLQAKTPIPDIVLLVNNKLIFIEVKIGNEIPNKQVLNQIRMYLNDYDFDVNVKHLYWENIVKSLSKIYSKDFFIKDYLELIASDYPNWFNYNFKELYDIMRKDKNNNIIYKEFKDLEDDNNLINVRIYRLLDEYCKKNNIMKHSCFDKRRSFPLINSFTSEMQFRFVQEGNRLESHIWTGELIEYTKNFNNYYKNNKILVDSFINGKSDRFDGEYYIVPYILFRSYFSYLSSISILKLKNKIIPEDICNLLSGSKEYNEFEKIISDNINEIKKYIPDIKNYFDDIVNKFYVNTKRTNMTISIGYDIVISYPQDVYFDLDENNKLDKIVDNSIEVYNKYFNTKVG